MKSVFFIYWLVSNRIAVIGIVDFRLDNRKTQKKSIAAYFYDSRKKGCKANDYRPLFKDLADVQS
ncbi:MAG: hypothetical protein ACYSUY_17235 [Planctomycetota bacterium]|jgi:hypothetical protein